MGCFNTGFFFNAMISSDAVARVFLEDGEPILKIPKIVERQWFDTLHDGLPFLNWIPEFR